MFNTYISTRVSAPNVNVNFKHLEKPLGEIKDAINHSTDRMIESQKDKFIELNGLSLRASLIEGMTNIKNKGFTVIMSQGATTGSIDFTHETDLGIRMSYNAIASVLGIELNGDVCGCGNTHEKLEIPLSDQNLKRFGIFPDFNDLCEECRLRTMLNHGAYRKVPDYTRFSTEMQFIDGQTKRIDPLNRYESFGDMGIPEGRW